MKDEKSELIQSETGRHKKRKALTRFLLVLVMLVAVTIAVGTCAFAANCSKCGAYLQTTAGGVAACSNCAATCSQCGAYLQTTVDGDIVACPNCTLSSHTCNTSGGTYEKQPTCTANGYILYYCSVCGKQSGSSTKGYEATGHSYVETQEAVAATCTSAGKTAISTCSSCGDTTGGTTIAATGHSWSVYGTNGGPTCTTALREYVVCDNCGTKSSRLVGEPDPTAHNYKTTTTTSGAGTCTDPKYSTTTTACSYCGAVSDGPTSTLVAANHSAQAFYNAPTCTSAGSSGSYCRLCGTTLSAYTIAAAGHTSATKYEDASDAEHNVIEYCSVCSTTISTTTASHSFTESYESNDDAKTHTTTYSCATCGHSHTASETCTNNNGVCSLCNQKLQYTITFNGNGNTSGSMSNQVITYGTTTALTANAFKRTGYTFQGWATSASGSVAYANGASVTDLGNTTLYAVWKANTYYVAFHANGGSGSMSNQTLTYGASGQTLTVNTFTKTGYTFAGWADSATDGVVDYADGASVSKMTSTNGATVNLYAVWTANTNTAYTIKHWRQNLGAAITQNSTNYTLKDTENKTGTTDASVTPAVKTYTGFTSPSTQTGTIAADGSLVVNYYYTRNSYTFTLGSGTGVTTTGSTSTGSYQYGATITLKASANTGYTWSKWTSSNTSLVANKTTANTTFTMPAGNVKMTPSATANTYTLTFHGNGSTGGTMATQTLAYDTDTNIKLNAFVRQNPSYSFIGWATSATGSVVYTDGQSVKNLTAEDGGNIDLYAVWRVDNVCTITKHPSNVTITYGESTTLSAAATGIVPSTPAHTMTYQWQKSTNNSTWTDIDGATTTSYTIPAGQNAGTYYYRMVATCTIPSFEGVYSDAVISATSNSAKVIINKAPGILNVSDMSGVALSDGAKLLYVLDDGDVETALLSCNDGATISVTSSDITKVRTSLSENNVLTLTPTGTTDNGVDVVIRTSESTNYEVTSLTLKVYVCNGATITVAYNTTDYTNQDVVATITVIDELSSQFPEHQVLSVAVEETELESSGNNQYTYTIPVNGTYTVIATDSKNVVTTKDLEVTWIDKESPTLSVVSEYDLNMYMFMVYIISFDNVSAASNIQFCWDYDESNVAGNVWTSSNVRYVNAGTELNVAVRDEAGNISSVSYTVTGNGSSDDESAANTSILASVNNDMTGKIFGKTSYLENSASDTQATNYENGVYTVTLKVKPKNSSQYIAGYIKFAGAEFPVIWYSDEAMTTPIDTLSDDGSYNLARGTAYGKVQLMPALFTGKTIRNATAELYIVRYGDTALSEKVAAEKYTMSCAIDVTAPSLTATYNEYTRTVTLRSKDAISGLAHGIQCTIGGTTFMCSASDELLYPAAAEDVNEFTINLTAQDKLGNVATASYTFKPYSNNTTGSGSGESLANDVNTYRYRTRLFDVYILNGTTDNSKSAAE